MSAFRVYLSVVRIGLSGAMEYRVNYLVNTVVTVLVTLCVQIFLWMAVYKDSPSATVAGMNLSTMLVYICCSVMCLTLTRNSMREREQAMMIRTGGLNNYLVKPVSHALYTFALAIAERVSQSAFVLIPSLLILIPLSSITDVPLSVTGTLLAIPILILGGIMNFLMGLFISYLAFWLDEVWTFHAIKDIALSLLSGMVFPLAALPQPWRDYSALLPFQFFAYVPAALMNGALSTSSAPLYLLQAVLWTGWMTLCVWMIWRIGLRRYNAFGG